MDHTDLRSLTRQFPWPGRVEAILLRPRRDVPAERVLSAMALAGRGLEGDRSANGTAPASGLGSKRQVTLFQAEHLPLLAAWARRESLDPAVLRRNLVVSGINLVALRSPFADRVVHVGIGAEVVLVITGPCDPCSKMEAALGTGAYNMMRGHGGMTARVVRGGRIEVGDAVRAIVTAPSAADTPR